VIFVKLRQFSHGDAAQRCVRPSDGEWRRQQGELVTMKDLHAFVDERVRLVKIPPAANVVFPAGAKGTELLVLRGSMEAAALPCPQYTWVRSPKPALGVRSELGCLIWLKQGHLPRAHSESVARG